MSSALLLLFVGLPQALPCGAFFKTRALSAGRQPSLAYEQVLLIHDAEKQRQHFIRELVFRHGTSTFGFVVPTPTRPKVAEVGKSPFGVLHRNFPFDFPKRSADGAGFGSGHGRLGGGPGVSVLEISRVGSFTAFVLAADDEKALGKWLSDNQLVSTKDAERWLSHYVRLRFYYVAFRYDPPKPGADKQKPKTQAGDADSDESLKAETVRISFRTPLPYYPYLEPTAPAGVATQKRLLDLWVVGATQVSPVALRERGREREWVRPLRPGRRFERARATLTEILDPAIAGLLPAGELWVQTFQDQKSSRAGMGDVLFVPLTKRVQAADDRSALEPLLGLLDPELLPQEPRR